MVGKYALRELAATSYLQDFIITLAMANLCKLLPISAKKFEGSPRPQSA